MVKISIIMTINNTEYLVERTVESIIKQTIKDIEVIAINKLPEVGERFYFAIASSKFKQ